jgi:hypothetical protein
MNRIVNIDSKKKGMDLPIFVVIGRKVVSVNQPEGKKLKYR